MSISKTFKEGSFEYKFEAIHHKKLPYTLVYVKIDTTEKDLLHSLTCKYKKDKLLKVGTNANNFMIDCISGQNGIVIYTLENRIINNVMMYIKYLSTMTLNSKQLYGKKGSYKKLLSSLEKVEVYVTGKCKTFIKNCMLKDSPKMKNMMTTIKLKQNKDREDIVNDKFDESMIKEVELDCNEEQALDCIISFNTSCVNVKKEGGKYVFGFMHKPEYSNYTGSIRGLLKAFRGQDGAPGSPASNDDGQKKYKEKCKEILNCVNMVAFCISDVRGVKCEYKNIEQLKQVNSESVKFITQLMK